MKLKYEKNHNICWRLRFQGIEGFFECFPEMEQEEYVLVYGYGLVFKFEPPGIGQKIFLMPAVKPEEVTGYVASADVGVCFENKFE